MLYPRLLYPNQYQTGRQLSIPSTELIFPFIQCFFVFIPLLTSSSSLTEGFTTQQQQQSQDGRQGKERSAPSKGFYQSASDIIKGAVLVSSSLSFFVLKILKNLPIQITNEHTYILIA